MNTWTLVILATLSSSSSPTPQPVAIADGYASESECKAAGEESKLISWGAKTVGYLCVPMPKGGKKGFPFAGKKPPIHKSRHKEAPFAIPAAPPEAPKGAPAIPWTPDTVERKPE